ncbi:hypothetical protein J2T17_004689 [Paenibacillus mucilaginosus]|uniref:hypothetical protein n=1 Tax=Paenibacillus mucilaginosus TaxID=61624 RepID=UPI003D1E147B
MKPLAIANFERLDTKQFLVAHLYGEDGYLLDVIIFLCEEPAEAIEEVRKLAETYRISTVEMWTSTGALYLESLKGPGVFGVIKHPSETSCTASSIKQDADVLRDLYEIEPPVPKPVAPKWRAAVVRVLCWLKTKFEGDYQYEI